MHVQPIAWSPSRVNTFESCPSQFQHFNVLKDVKYEQGAPQAEGERVHKALEMRLANKIALDPKDARLEPLIVAIERMPGTTYAERDYALDHNLRPCGYFDKACYVRVTIDVTNLRVADRFAWLGDYKTGKVKLDEFQLKAYAAVIFHYFTDIDTVKTNYLWLRDRLVNGATYTRAQLPEIWRELLKTPTAIQKAAEMNHWPAKPGRQCAWCTVNKFGKCPDAAERYRES